METLNLVSAGRLLRPFEVRLLFGIAASTLTDWVRAGKIKPAHRTLGGHRRYWETEVCALLAEARGGATP